VQRSQGSLVEVALDDGIQQLGLHSLPGVRFVTRTILRVANTPVSTYRFSARATKSHAELLGLLIYARQRRRLSIQDTSKDRKPTNQSPFLRSRWYRAYTRRDERG
jgi:hypothetical protein